MGISCILVSYRIVLGPISTEIGCSGALQKLRMDRNNLTGARSERPGLLSSVFIIHDRIGT